MGVDTIRIHIPGMHFIKSFINSENGLWQGKNLQSGIQITFHASHGATGKTWAAADLTKLHAVVRQVARESSQYILGGTYEFMFRQILGGSITVLDLTMDLACTMDEIDVVAPDTSFPDARRKSFLTIFDTYKDSLYWGRPAYTGKTDGSYHPATARELRLYDKTRQMLEVKHADTKIDIARLEMTLNRGDTVGRHMGVVTVSDLLKIGAREFRLRIASCFSELQITVRGEGVKPLTSKQRKDILSRGGIMARKLRRFERKNEGQKQMRNVEKTRQNLSRICLSIHEGYETKLENNAVLRGACRGEPGTTRIDDTNPCNDCVCGIKIHNRGGGKHMSAEEQRDIEEILEILQWGIVEVWDLDEVA